MGFFGGEGRGVGFFFGEGCWWGEKVIPVGFTAAAVFAVLFSVCILLVSIKCSLAQFWVCCVLVFSSRQIIDSHTY